MHLLYCWSDRPILCGNLIEFDGKKCLYSRSIRFYKHFDVSEKNMGCLAHQKIIFATFPLLANADKIHKYKTEWFSETETLLLLTLWQRHQEHFNRQPPLWHPYTLTFDLIPYTLKTLERYSPGIIEHIRVCGPRSGFSVVIRFATTSVLQNIHALVVVIPYPYRISIMKTSCTTSMNYHTINLSVHARKNDNSWHIQNLKLDIEDRVISTKTTEPMDHIYSPLP